MLLGLALGLYMIFRPAPDVRNRNTSGVNGYITNSDGTLTPSLSFAPLETQPFNNISSSEESCYYLNKVSLPKFDNVSCKTANCGYSVGLLL